MPVTGNGTAQTGLGGEEGYGEIMVPRSDDDFLQLDLSAVFQDGLNYFGVLYDATEVFVNTNGTLSFLSGVAAYPTSANNNPGRDLIAPFWGDADTRLDGEGTESGAIWVDISPETDTVTITWSDVGVYRRNADVSNTFQLHLIDRGGGDFDIVFRYEHIGWTIGSGLTDIGARAGLASGRLPTPAWMFDTDNAAGLADLPTTAGNTGVAGLWVYEMRDGAIGGLGALTGLTERGTAATDQMIGSARDDHLIGLGGDDTLLGNDGNDSLDGGPGVDLLQGGAGDDTLFAGDGSDTAIGGAGKDVVHAGDTEHDLRDVVYGGDGDDSIDGGYGNDILRGDAGNDTIVGGFGVDQILGGDGDDVLTGQAWSDLIYGGTGSDFINGGFGYDRVNGGTGADRFYHLGVANHGSDWIQDYSAAEGDVLQFGAAADPDDFQVNFTETANAGLAGVEEAFVIYRPTGLILWALPDGAAQERLLLMLEGELTDLLI